MECAFMERISLVTCASLYEDANERSKTRKGELLSVAKVLLVLLHFNRSRHSNKKYTKIFHIQEC